MAKSKRSDKVMFCRYRLIFRTATKVGKGKNKRTEMVYSSEVDAEESRERTPERGLFPRLAKGLLGTKTTKPWKYWYQMVKFNPSLRVFKDNSKGEVDLEKTLVTLRECMALLKEVLSLEGYELPQECFELEQFDRRPAEQKTLGFDKIDTLKQYQVKLPLK
tara:strand:+ start:107 stop:592 length:486 start_codon:yes stop_codon:yes gene_type:complete